MKYSALQIGHLINAGHIQFQDYEIESLLTDSRSLLSPEKTLFFAIRTSSGDGHRYISRLHDAGVRNFVVSHIPPGAESLTADSNFFVVESPINALQQVAASHRSQFDGTLIAITGSRGKTTVKEWVNMLLRSDRRIIRSPRSYNSQIGVPLSIWQIDESTDTAIIEAGISQPGEMDRLEKIIRPDIVVFTNLGSTHSEGFASMEEKSNEKAKLAAHCRTVIYNADTITIKSVIPSGPGHVGWSLKDPDSTLYISAIDSSEASGMTTITYTWRPTGETSSLTIPFTDSGSIENAIHCLALMLVLGYSVDVTNERMSGLVRVDTRLEVVEGCNGCQIINDAFTPDLASLSQALDFMDRRLTPGLSKTVILGDLQPDESDMEHMYGTVASLLETKNVTRFIGVGNELAAYCDLFPSTSRFYHTADEFVAKENPSDFTSELILLKGTHENGFDSILELLEARQHETVLEINLDALVDNFNYFRSQLKPTTGIICMIKAFGYGAGSYELAKTLQSQGATYLAVAVHDEGADLRRAGITMPIMVMNPAVENFRALFDYRLEPEIYSIDFLKRLVKEAERYDVRNYPVHIKIDSGMHRLGFRLETLPEVIDILKSQSQLVPKSIFSHLCAADDPMEDDYTFGQFDYFGKCCTMMEQAFPERKILRHILNSTGITRFPDHQLDMVRLGIGLYGVRTMHDGSQDQLRPVSALRSVIISIKHWPAGTTIGYNRRGVLKRDSVIATVPIGYADGLNRHLGYGRSSFNVNGVLCPVVGSICMDACMIDVTDAPDVRVGTRVEIFGDKISVETLSEELDTIPYEILTCISQRVKRIYFRE